MILTIGNMILGWFCSLAGDTAGREQEGGACNRELVMSGARDTEVCKSWCVCECVWGGCHRRMKVNRPIFWHGRGVILCQQKWERRPQRQNQTQKEMTFNMCCYLLYCLQVFRDSSVFSVRASISAAIYSRQLSALGEVDRSNTTETKPWTAIKGIMKVDHTSIRVVYRW